MVQAIAAQRGEWTALLEQELSRAAVPLVRRVHPKIELCALLVMLPTTKPFASLR